MALSPSSRTVTKPSDRQVLAFLSELLRLSRSSASPSVSLQCPSVPSSTGTTEIHSLCASTWDSKLLKASVCVSCTQEAITSVDCVRDQVRSQPASLYWESLNLRNTAERELTNVIQACFLFSGPQASGESDCLNVVAGPT